MTDLFQLLFYGIVSGSIIVLGAIGLSLIYGILNFAHFAHGDLMALGAYLAFLFKVGLGWPLWLALLVAMAGTAVAAIFIERSVYAPLRHRGSVTLLIASVGVALIVRNVIQMIWGADYQFYEMGIQFPWRVWGLRIKPDHVVILVAAFILVTAVHLFLRHTKMGKAMRAMADNAELAMVTGIDTKLVTTATWVIGGGLAAAAGVLLGLDTQLVPDMGWNLLLLVFSAVILGGIGSPYGAMAGAFIIGIATELSTMFIATSYKSVVAFVIMIAILLVRPSGIVRTGGTVRL